MYAYMYEIKHKVLDECINIIKETCKVGTVLVKVDIYCRSDKKSSIKRLNLQSCLQQQLSKFSKGFRMKQESTEISGKKLSHPRLTSFYLLKVKNNLKTY